MADVYSREETFNNAGTAIAGGVLGVNARKHRISQSDAGRELIVKISADAGILDTELTAAISEITRSQGSAGSGDSAFTVAAVGTAAGAAFVAGTTQVVFLRCQGTGSLTVADIKAAAEAADANGTTFTVTTEAIFAPAL
jgi:hypothetical protein